MRSFEGQSPDKNVKSDADETDSGVFWRPVYGIDRKLEKLF